MNSFCKIHRTENIIYYCVDEFCIEPQRVMCGKCYTDKFHKTHNFANIEDIQTILKDNHNNTKLLESEGLSQIEELSSNKIKKYLEMIEQTLMQWQKQKILSSRNLVGKKLVQSQQIMKKMFHEKIEKMQQKDSEKDEEEQKQNAQDISEDSSDDDDEDDDEEHVDFNDEEYDENDYGLNSFKQTKGNKKVEEFLQFSSEENQFIMQAIRDKKQNVSQKQQIEAMLSQKFSDIEIQIQKLQRFINNKYSFSMKEFKGVVKSSWHSEYVSDCPSILQFNFEQTLVTAAENSILLQNINEEVCEEISEAHELSIVALEKMNENMFVSGSYDGMIKSWCPRTGSRLSFRNSFHVSGVSCLKKLDKRHLISGDEIGNVVVSDVINNRIIRIMRNEFTSDMSQLCCIEVMHPQKLIITGSKKGIVDFWDYSRGEIVRQIKMYSSIRSFFMPTSFLLMVGQNDGSITCWDCRTGVKVKTYDQEHGLGTIKRLGPDTFVASYYNKKIKFFNFMHTKPFKQIEHDEDVIGILPLYKNNQIATVDNCNELTLWE